MLPRSMSISLVVVLLAACGAPITSPRPMLSATPGDGGEASAQPAWPLKDLSARPQIWFSPLDPWSWDRFDPGSGPHQFYDLFTKDAPWEQAAEATGVFGLNSNWLESFGNTTEMRQVVADLGLRGIALWTEAGQLSETPQCNAATLEGFSGAPPARAAASRLLAAGGVLYSFKLEHGFDAATFYDEACRMSPDAIAADTAKTVATVRSVFPNVVIGSVETANLDADAVAAWLQAYRDAVGEELGYFHLDVNYGIPDWPARARAIEDVVHARGIEFGIIYFGDEGDATDAAWLAHAEARFVEYEVIAGGRPDHAVFQSWHRHPVQLLPETEPATFTNLIDRYLRPRSSLELQLGDSAAGGGLTASDGTPIAGADVQLSARPVSGPGVIATYTISGVVPEGATEADVGLRVNMECECSGSAELVLDGVRYQEADESGNRVPNGDFAGGLDGWGAWGTGSRQLSGNGSAAALRLTASTGEDIGLNSAAFAVTPGATFAVTFTAQVAPASAGSGYFSVVFLDGSTELQRSSVDLSAGTIALGHVQTDAGGVYEFSLSGLPQGVFEVRAWYAGDEAFWPAMATKQR